MGHELIRRLLHLLVLVTLHVSAVNLWTGPAVNFSKAAGANHTLAENQDRLTSNVWITRANTQGIFNIAQEAAYNNIPLPVSPVGTEWALGSISMGVQTLTFKPWETTVRSIAPGAGPPNAVNAPMVVHLLADDIYLNHDDQLGRHQRRRLQLHAQLTGSHGDVECSARTVTAVAGHAVMRS